MTTWRDFRAGDDYLVPDLVELTVDDAIAEWQGRYGGDRIDKIDKRLSTGGTRSAADGTVALAGFTGSISPSGASGSAIVTAFSTVPAAAIGISAPASTALVLHYLAYLATPAGDHLVTPGGDRLTVTA